MTTERDSKYGHYIVRQPLREVLNTEGEQATGVKQEGWSGSHTYMSVPLVGDSPVHMFYTWIYEIPTPNPYVEKHEHPYDEVLFFMGTNADDVTDLGASCTVELEDEVHTIDTVAAIYIPAGMRHCPITYTRVDRPHSFVALSVSGRYITDEKGQRYESPDIVAAS